jgi:peptidyl-prolyl cis-trans isomerase D
MLDSFRKISKTWFGKLIGGFLIIGLAGFGISNVIFDIGTNTVARVGDEEITAREFQRAYSTDLQRFAQQVGQMPTPEQSLAMGIPESTLNRLASAAAINRLAQQLGIGVSNDRLAIMLRQDPTFAGTLGQFERQNFLRALQQSGYTEAEYFELQKRAARRQQLETALFADTEPPAAALELVGGYAGDTRSIDYFVLNEDSIAPVAEPTEQELAAYLDEHQAEFRTQELRSVDVLTLSPETLAATITIPDAEVEAEYERTRASRAVAERRQIQQVPLTSEEHRQLFEEGLAAGESFEALVAEAGLRPTDLGLLSQAQVTDSALAEAAFGLEAGEFAIIPGVGGQRAVAVTEIVPGGEAPLDEVRDEIARDLALAQARDQYLDMLDQIEELRATFEPLQQIGERFGLPVRSVEVSASGSELSAVPEIPTEDRARVAQRIFAAQEEQLTPAVQLSANRNVWFDLEHIEPARDQTLEEVRAEVREAVIAERTQQALAAAAEQAVAQLDAGRSLSQVASELGERTVRSAPFGRGGAELSAIGPDVAAAAFAGGEDHYGSALNADGHHVVFEVAEIVPAADGATAEVTQFMERTLRDSLFGEFVAGVRDDAGLRINRQALNQLIAPDPATGQ